MPENKDIQQILDNVKSKKLPSVFGSKSTVRGAFIGVAGGWILAGYLRLPKWLGVVTGIAIGTTAADVIDGYLNNTCNKIIKQKDETTDDQ